MTTCQYQQGKEYAALLTVHEYKCKIVQYISNKLVSTCIEKSSQTTSVSFVIESPSLPSILHIARGTMNIMESNKHGEGDVGVWHHCLCQPEKNFIIFSSDTDVWMYGLLITELSYQLQTKHVYVKCLNSSPLV